MRRTLLLLMATIGLLAVALVQPAAAQYTPGQPGFVIDPPVVPPGTPVNVIGSGCPRGSEVLVIIEGQVVGQGIAADDESGSFTIGITAPQQSGDYVVTVECGSTVMTQILTVTPTACSFTINGAPGARVSGSIEGYLVGSTYTLVFQSDPVQVGSGTVASDPQLIEFTIPSDATPGAHTLSIVGTGANGQTKILDCAATVSSALPRTGSDSAVLLQAGVALLAIGGLVLLIARRRPEAA